MPRAGPRQRATANLYQVRGCLCESWRFWSSGFQRKPAENWNQRSPDYDLVLGLYASLNDMEFKGMTLKTLK